MSTKTAWAIMAAAVAAATFANMSIGVRATVYSLAAITVAAKIGAELWLRTHPAPHKQP